MTEHTPLPWHHKQLIKDMWTIIGDWDGKHGQGLATTVGLLEPTDEANAELIVRAVNAHNDLLAVCRAATELLDALSLEKAGVLTGHSKSLIARLKLESALGSAKIEGAAGEGDSTTQKELQVPNESP